MTAPARNMGAEAARALALHRDPEYARLYAEWSRLNDGLSDRRRPSKEHEERAARALARLTAREEELAPCSTCEGASVVAANRSCTSFEACEDCGGSGMAREFVGGKYLLANARGQ